MANLHITPEPKAIGLKYITSSHWSSSEKTRVGRIVQLFRDLIRKFEQCECLMSCICGFNSRGIILLLLNLIKNECLSALTLIYSHRCALLLEPVLFYGTLPEINYSTSIFFVYRHPHLISLTQPARLYRSAAVLFYFY